MHERDEKYSKAWLKGYNDGLLNGIGRGRTEVLDKISAEIKDTCTWDDKTLTPTIGAEKVLEIIEKYKKGESSK